MKILIIRLGAVGDVIRTIPVLSYLHKKLKNPEIHWIVEDRAGNLLENHPLLKKVFIIPRKKYYKIFKILKDIRKENFDIVLDFHGLLKSGLISFFSNCNVRIGFSKKNSKEFNWIFNNFHCEDLPEKITRIEKNFYLLKVFLDNVKIPDKLELNLNIENAKIEKIENFLKKLSFKKFIVINPFVSKAGRYKEWPYKYFGKLIKIINKSGEIAFIITWGPDEYDKAKKIYDIAKANNVFLAPKTDMKELAVLFSKIDAVVTCDTGPMHLASLLNVPVFAIFGPSDVNINRPWGDKNFVVYKNVGCNPCRNKSCNDLKCLKILTPEYVANLLTQWLSSVMGFNNL